MLLLLICILYQTVYDKICHVHGSTYSSIPQYIDFYFENRVDMYWFYRCKVINKFSIIGHIESLSSITFEGDLYTCIDGSVFHLNGSQPSLILQIELSKTNNLGFNCDAFKQKTLYLSIGIVRWNSLFINHYSPYLQKVYYKLSL